MRTDIAAFVGFAERGPLPEDFPPDFDASQVAVRLTSWAEFRARFGGFLPNAMLAFAVNAFFANGGDTCYVVRVAASRADVPADRQPMAAAMPLAAGLPTTAGTLAAAGAAWSARLDLAAGVTPAALVGNLVTISRDGLSQTAVVQAQLGDGSLLLSTPLDGGFAAGDTVALYPAAATVAAANRGTWGNRLRLDLTDLGGGAFALKVVVDLGPERLATEQEFYPRLTPATAAAVIAAQSSLIVWSGVGQPALTGGTTSIYLTGGRDGVADATLADFAGAATDRRGLRLLEEIDEVAIVAVPDAVLTIAPPLVGRTVAPTPCAPPRAVVEPPPPPDPTGTPTPLGDDDRLTLQTMMIEQCERLNYRVALIDPPAGLQPVEMSLWPAAQGLVNTSAKFAALYYPWLGVPDPLGLPGACRLIPPSGHVAGTYAQTDLTVGVQHPPANLALAAIADVAQPISAAQSGLLNSRSVNAIRALPGRGIRVWGVRSMSSDPAWRFIHCRRLVSAIEETCQRSSRWAVFETHNAALRYSLSHALTVLLEGIWAAGGLLGNKPAEGFYVRCDATNNPPAVVDAGQLVCEIGVSVAAPMEFIVFEIRQDVVGASVAEA